MNANRGIARVAPGISLNNAIQTNEIILRNSSTSESAWAGLPAAKGFWLNAALEVQGRQVHGKSQLS